MTMVSTCYPVGLCREKMLIVKLNAFAYKILGVCQIDTMDEISVKPVWPLRNLFFVTFFLYACFAASVFIIPDSISSGESLSFAFTFSMIQMVEVSLFMRFESWLNFFLLCLSLVTASVLPTMQIFLVMQGEYSQLIQNICGYVYMSKELVLVFTSRSIFMKSHNLRRAHIVVLSVWVIFEILFLVLIGELEYEKNTWQKLLCLARLTPFFCMACLTFLRMTKCIQNEPGK